MTVNTSFSPDKSGSGTYNLSLLRQLFGDPQTNPAQATAEWLKQAWQADETGDRSILTILLRLLEHPAFPLPLTLQIEQAYFQGQLHMLQHETTEAEAAFYKGLALLETSTGPDKNLTAAYFWARLAGIIMTRALPDQAEEVIKKVLATGQEYQDDYVIWLAYYNLGRIYYFRGEIEKAIEVTRQSIAVAEKTANLVRLSLSYNNLGVFYLNHAQLVEAQQALREAVRLRQLSGGQRALAPTYINLGAINFRLKQYQASVDNYETALAIYQMLNDREAQAMALINKTSSYIKLEQPGRGLEDAIRGVQLYREVQNQLSLAWALSKAAICAYQLGRAEVASVYINEACQIADSADPDDNATDIASTYLDIAEALATLARDEADRLKAIEYYQHGLELFEQVGDPESVMDCLAHLAELVQVGPNGATASLEYCRRWWQKAITLSSLGLKLRLDELFKCARILGVGGQANESLVIYQAGFALSDDGHSDEEKLKLAHQYLLASEQAHPAEAAPLLEQAVRLYRLGHGPQSDLKRLASQLDALKKQLKKK